MMLVAFCFKCESSVWMAPGSFCLLCAIVKKKQIICKHQHFQLNPMSDDGDVAGASDDKQQFKKHKKERTHKTSLIDDDGVQAKHVHDDESDEKGASSHKHKKKRISEDISVESKAGSDNGEDEQKIARKKKKKKGTKCSKEFGEEEKPADNVDESDALSGSMTAEQADEPAVKSSNQGGDGIDETELLALSMPRYDKVCRCSIILIRSSLVISSFR